MNQTTAIVIAAVVLVVLLLLFYLLRGRRQHVSFDATAATPRAAVTPPAAPAPLVPDEGQGIGDEVTAAVEDVVDQFIGIDAHPSGQLEAAGDTLTQLKGLGPKAAARLGELGVTRFAQIAAWDEADVAAIDAQMGAFKGRILRDRWVEQAALLAAEDREAFEAKFGKLGG